MYILMCPERDELEKQIRAALKLALEKSKHAKRMTDGDGFRMDANEFTAIREEYGLLSERVRVLRECLQLHKSWHNC